MADKIFYKNNRPNTIDEIAKITCAEIITIGMALTAEKDMEIDMIVAVRDKEGYIISPCGKCREYIADYSHSQARVIVPVGQTDKYDIVSVADLLPNKYCKRI